MNPLAEYRRWLQSNGFTDSDADRIARARLGDKKRQAGSIRVEKAADNTADLYIYEFIGFDWWTGDGFTPKKLLEQIAALGDVDKITVHVNCPGGDVFDGMTIYNLLLRQETTIAVEVEGLAASAASFIVQAADDGELAVWETATLMIHRAWGMTVGNTHDMAAQAAVLEMVDGQIAGIYSSRSGRKSEEFLSLMDNETWFTAEEAVNAKLADRVITAQRAAASIDPASLSAYRNVPAALLNRPSSPADEAQPNRPLVLDPPPAAADNAADAERIAVRLRLLELDAI